MKRFPYAAALCAAALSVFLAFAPSAEPAEDPPLPAQVILTPVRTLRHDAGSFCQGLFCGGDADGALFFYESAGRYGRSAIKRVSLDGKTLEKKKLPRREAKQFRSMPASADSSLISRLARAVSGRK